MPKTKMTQEELRETIDKHLYSAQDALGRVSNLLSDLDSNGSFVSLAKVNADNLATMVSNLMSRIKHDGPS